MDRKLQLTESNHSNSYRTNHYLMGPSVCRCIQESLQFSTIAHCLDQPRPHAHRAPTVGNNTNEEGSIPWPRESKGGNYSVSHWREGVLMFGESGGRHEKLHPMRRLQCLSQVKRSLWKTSRKQPSVTPLWDITADAWIFSKCPPANHTQRCPKALNHQAHGVLIR